MADGLRYPPASANFYYNTNQRNLNRNGTPPNTVRGAFNNHSVDAPSPSRSPAANSPAQNPYGMYGQGHNQAQHGRVNGGPNGRGIPQMMYQYQHQGSHQGQQQHSHHPNMQQDHNAHGTTGSILGHQQSFSSGILNNSTPSFTASLPNGHSSTTRGGQAQQITESWAEQLKLHKEVERAHVEMVDKGETSYYARKYTAQYQNGKGPSPQNAAPKLVKPSAEEKEEDRGRPSDDEDVKTQSWADMDFSGVGLRVLSSTLFAYDFLHQLYIPSNKLSYIPAEIGKLRKLTYLDASHNLLTEVPPELGMCVGLEKLLLFDNHISTLPHELGYLHKLEMLGIEGNPLDSSLKTKIMEEGTRSLITLLREEAPAPEPPPPRQLLDLTEGSSAFANQEKIKVLSFNILCERSCTAAMYGHTPSSALTWDFRKRNILDEIRAKDADFVCLQEVDCDSFKEWFCPELSYQGYKGIHLPKSRAKTMSEKEARQVDGCAIFYKGNKYLMLDKQYLDFTSLAINRPDMKSSDDIFNRYMPKDHNGIITFFENRLTGTRFIVATAHLHWDPKFADVKVIQTAILMECISKAAEKYTSFPPTKDKDRKVHSFSGDQPVGEEAKVEIPAVEPAPSMKYTNATQIPLIVAGDFNSTADSGVYELLVSGSLDPSHPDLRNRSYGNFTRDGIQHPFSLRSAYARLNGGPDALTFTNFTPGFVGVVDYIWFSTNTLELIQLLGPVDPNYMKKVPGFPNYHFPSDHLSLLAEFAVKGRKENKYISSSADSSADFGGTSSAASSRGRQQH